MNVRGKVITEKLLSDIISFEWSTKPFTVRTPHMLKRQHNNDIVLIVFRDKFELTFTRDEYENFETIRNYLFQYCKKNKIVN